MADLLGQGVFTPNTAATTSTAPTNVGAIKSSPSVVNGQQNAAPGSQGLSYNPTFYGSQAVPTNKVASASTTIAPAQTITPSSGNIAPTITPPATSQNTPSAYSTGDNSAAAQAWRAANNPSAPNANINDNTGKSADQLALEQNNQAMVDAASAFSNTITNIQNGTTPLNAGEQAQVDSLKQQFQQMIDQQTQTNTSASGIANVRGYQTGAAEYDPTFQVKTINSIISAGQQKITDLQTKEASAVASLTQSLKDGDISRIKEAYDVLNNAQKDRQTQLQKTITDTQNAIKDAQDQQQKIQDTAEKIREFDKNYQLDMNKYNLDVQTKLGEGIGGNGSLDEKTLDMLAQGYLTSGVLPSLGMGTKAATARAQILNKAAELSGGNMNVSQNKAVYDANKNALKTQTANLVQAQTSYNIFDKNGAFALNLVQGLNQSNSPVVNQLNNSIINQTTGTGQLDSFRAVITSLQSEYATLISIKGGAGGQTTEADKAKAEKAIPNDISPNRLKQVIANLKVEGQNVIGERQATIDELSKTTANAGQTFDTKIQQNPFQLLTNPSLTGSVWSPDTGYNIPTQ